MPVTDKSSGGSGCRGFEGVYSNNHNPPPSTDRGRRRHERRSEDHKNRVGKLWGKKSNKK